MKQFQDLEISGDPSRFAAFEKDLASAVAPPWSTREANPIAGSPPPLLFVLTERDGTPEATVVLSRGRRGRPYTVPNIMPTETGELSYEQYNAILQEFRRFITPIAARHDLEVNITDSRFNIDDHLSKESVKRLKTFATTANKSTGSGHPSDRRRWLDFIIQTHRDQNDASSVLERYLVEVAGWDEDMASKLLSQYIIALAVLKRYDETA